MLGKKIEKKFISSAIQFPLTPNPVYLYEGGKGFHKTSNSSSDRRVQCNSMPNKNPKAKNPPRSSSNLATSRLSASKNSLTLFHSVKKKNFSRLAIKSGISKDLTSKFVKKIEVDEISARVKTEPPCGRNFEITVKAPTTSMRYHADSFQNRYLGKKHTSQIFSSKIESSRITDQTFVVNVSKCQNPKEDNANLLQNGNITTPNECANVMQTQQNCNNTNSS